MGWLRTGLAFSLLFGGMAPAAAQLRIAIVGDSAASGEGNPDTPAVRCRPGPGPGGSARICDTFPGWSGRSGRASTTADTVCHRSTASGLLRAAEQLARDLAGREPVIIETFACSGATTRNVGTTSTSAFSAQYSLGTVTVPAQLQALIADPSFSDVAGGPVTGNRIDAIIMMVGANDIGFGPTVSACATNLTGECYRGMSVSAALAPLPGLYAALQAAIDAPPSTNPSVPGGARGRVGNIFIVEYFDPSVGGDDYCGATTALDPGPFVRPPDFNDLPAFWGISWYESRFASTVLVPALNAAVAAGARANGWRYVGGVAERFRGHGYCVRDRWVRNLNDSLSLEGGPWGALHPNRAGHDALRDIVLAALAPYRQTLAAPGTTAIHASLGSTLLSWTGGAGPRRQVASLALADARPSAPLPPLPGFAGDGARQRVGLDAQGRPASLALPGSLPGDATAGGWLLAELEGADRIELARATHWLTAVRSCNELRCSGWSPAAVTPPSVPRSAFFVRDSGGVIRPSWTTHARNGVYQVAVPTGGRRWDIVEVPALAGADVLTTAGASAPATVWSEAPATAPPPGVRRDDRRAARGEIALTPATAFAQVSEFYVRGCNQTGCSAWAAGADFVNSLRAPEPGRLRVVMSPLPCRRENGRVTCPTADQGVRVSSWREVPGANIYQAAAYRSDGTVDALTFETATARIEGAHRGFRVRACNVAGCSAWSAAVMRSPTLIDPPAPANLRPPPNASMAEPAGSPPSNLPNSTF